jgi:RNA polymerase sigma-70 factor (sigma-E family)
MIEVGVEEESVDRSRLGELYVRYAPEGIKLAYLLTGDRMLAEDLVQEAFARFVGRLGHLRHPDAFGSYLRSTIVNLSRSHFRRRKVERAYIESASRAPMLPPPVDAGFDHEVHEALLRLPERQRAALVLRFYEDLSDAQTAEVMRCRPGTVRSLVSRAMQTIRAEVGVTIR